MLYLRGAAGTRRVFNCYVFLILKRLSEYIEHIQSLLVENTRLNKPSRAGLAPNLR